MLQIPGDQVSLEETVAERVLIRQERFEHPALGIESDEGRESQEIAGLSDCRIDHCQLPIADCQLFVWKGPGENLAG